MKKNILLISHNFSPEPTGIGKYNGEMMDWLAKHGYNCTVITTFPYYPHWKVQKPYKNGWYKVEKIKEQGEGSLTIYRCPFYVPQNPTGKKRMIQDISFWTSKFWIILKLIILKKRFDLIITVAPPFHLAYLGLMIRKFGGGKLLYHVQDMQIEAAEDLKMLNNNKMFNRLYKIEKDILIKADYISSISAGMIKKIEVKASKKVHLFPNWVDTDVFFPLDNRDLLKGKWGYKPDDIVFLYSGAIGEKQGLDGILQAANKLKDKPKIKFIICGSGPYKEKLISFAEEHNLNNVSFLPVQKGDVFNAFLNIADIHMILQKSNASDLVMPSKLTTILAVGGVSIVTTPAETSLHKIFEENDMGYLIAPEDAELLSNAILRVKLDSDYRLKQQNARNYAIKYLNIENVMETFVNDFIDN